jgi:hypothetical protein
MKPAHSIAWVILAVLTLPAVPSPAATIQLELYNSYPLLDESSTPLLGNTNSGDLVQFILTGPDNAINPPDQYGNLTGDDTLLFTTHVGYGSPGFPDQGYLDVFPIPYSSDLVSSNVYVRFWNSPTAAPGTSCGNTVATCLGSGCFSPCSAISFGGSGAGVAGGWGANGAGSAARIPRFHGTFSVLNTFVPVPSRNGVLSFLSVGLDGFAATVGLSEYNSASLGCSPVT